MLKKTHQQLYRDLGVWLRHNGLNGPEQGTAEAVRVLGCQALLHHTHRLEQPVQPWGQAVMVLRRLQWV